MGASLLAIFCLALGVATAHPTHYPHRAALMKDSQGNACQPGFSGVMCEIPPPILSYHVHIVFNLVDVEEALRLRDRTIEHLKEWLAPECTGRFDTGRFCMIRDHDFEKILIEGPFPSGEWSIFVPPPYLELVQTYLVQQRGPFSLLTHPNTGFMIPDHDEWAMWAGASWPLNMHAVNVTHAEDKHTRGDAANPVCVSSGDVCGELLPSFPTLLPCCDGATCGCGKSICRCGAKNSTLKLN